MQKLYMEYAPRSALFGFEKFLGDFRINDATRPCVVKGLDKCICVGVHDLKLDIPTPNGRVQFFSHHEQNCSAHTHIHIQYQALDIPPLALAAMYRQSRDNDIACEHWTKLTTLRMYVNGTREHTYPKYRKHCKYRTIIINWQCGSTIIHCASAHCVCFQSDTVAMSIPQYKISICHQFIVWIENYFLEIDTIGYADVSCSLHVPF